VKKSRSVSIPFVSSLAGAALAAGCGSSYLTQQQGWQTCVDRNNGTTVERQYCDDEQNRPHATGYTPHYHWYYYPRGYYWNGPRIGSPVPAGGTYGVTSFGAPVSRAGSAIGSGGSSLGAAVRGGFGSTAAGHASSGA